MEHGQVRAILGRHAQHGLAAPSAPRGDPTLLVPASTLRKAIEGLDAAGQRALAHDYVALWSRTFRTLAQHLRGRPERALALFAEEVYPFLRGDRRASRVERLHRHEARILLPSDLPDAYHCGLLEAFVGLSGARAIARPDGNGAFTVAFRVAPADRLARTAQQLAQLRLPLVACVALAAATGLVASVAGEGHTGSAGLVLLGVVAAQLGANALHGLRNPAGSPMSAPRLARGLLLAGALAAYTVAALCAAVLTARAGWPVLAFAAIGLALGLAYARFRAEGLGPAVAGLTYGVLVPAGAAYAQVGGFEAWPLAFAVILAAPLGLAAAAMLLLDNMADRPLDEAGGQRTLAVRLGGTGQSVVFIGLVASALAWLAVSGVLAFGPLMLPTLVAVALVPAAVWLCRRVAEYSSDPRGLGAARLAALAFLLALAAVPFLDLVVYL